MMSYYVHPTLDHVSLSLDVNECEGIDNAGYRVPAKPLRFELWGVHEDLLPTDPRPKALPRV